MAYCSIPTENQDAVGDGRLRPGAANWRTGRNIRLVFDCGLIGALYKNMTSSTNRKYITYRIAVRVNFTGFSTSTFCGGAT